MGLESVLASEDVIGDLIKSDDVNPVLNHLFRDEFGITLLGEREHVPGDHTKRLASRWCGSRCALCLVGSSSQLVTSVLVPRR